jgi:hypothetical protein
VTLRYIGPARYLKIFLAEVQAVPHLQKYESVNGALGFRGVFIGRR